MRRVVGHSAESRDSWLVPLIEWTRLEPGQVEAVVSMLVNREHPTSVRITPSRGDGGVDILARRQGPTGGDVVYQVKSFTNRVKQREKNSIEESLTTLGTDERWAGLSIEEWHLVTPLNPSPEAETWLHGLGEAAGITTVWQGLDHVEQLAARYPDVVDYYLHDGQARIAAAQAEVLSLVGVEHVSNGLSAEDVTERIRRALGVLDHDPHYRFEVQFGEGALPAPRDRDGLVMSCFRGHRTAEWWVGIDVIARCAASTEVQPITINGTVNVEPDTALADEWDAFMTYGAPVTLPSGTFTGEVNAPGGLGGPLADAVLRTGPTLDADVGDDPEMHLEVLDTERRVIAAVDIDRVERSRGMVGVGLRAVLQETNGIFTIEDRYNLFENRGSRNVSIGEITGLPVEAARAGVEVLANLHAPNQLRISRRHTPPERGIVDVNIGFDWQEDQAANLGATLRILQTLCEIQAGTSSVLRTPDFARVPREQFRDWRVAAALLRGEEVTGTYPEGHALTIDLESEVTPGEEPLGISLPHTVLVDDQVADLGRYEVWLESPTLLGRQVNPEGGISHTFTTPDRTVVWRRPDPTDD